MDVAIIGVSLRLPNNIHNLDDLYDRLKNKIDCISDHPVERFNPDAYYDKYNSIGKMNTLRSGYLSDVYHFDNAFFKMSNKEARTTDPQQRIMLELVYQAIQDSHQSLDSFRNTNTGVFMGSCNTEYFSNQTENPEYCNDYSLPGGLLTLVSNRISYFYDLKGPSVTMDTACSSSGHALHLACQSLQRGETDMCFVGGANLILNPETTVGFSQGKFLSPDGKCKSFDETADGYVRSEGCVVFLLKPLERAVEDGNVIHAVIKQTVINQDGKTDSITMPNGDLQKELLMRAYKNIDRDTVTYVEAHGTGTKVGDKIEADSIGTVLGTGRSTGRLPMGSIKSLIGHTEATSGLVSICKIILMMRERELLPNLHFTTPSSNIDFKKLNIEVVTEVTPIKTERIIMGVNNYGFGGSNFHGVLENYGPTKKRKTVDQARPGGIHMLVLTGSDEESIEVNMKPFLSYSEHDLLKYVYNQNLGAEPLEETKVYLFENKADLCERVQENQPSDLSVVHGMRQTSGKTPSIGFVFCGQGPQYLEMGMDFMEKFPTFRAAIMECDRAYAKVAGFSFLNRYGIFTTLSAGKSKDLMNDPIVAQPAITFFQIALVCLYREFGIQPNTVLGHSAGEQAAFYVAGVLSLADTVRISYYRSILQQKTAGTGNMLVINQPLQAMPQLLNQWPKLRMELAAVNSATSYVLAGSATDVDALMANLEGIGIKAIKIAGRCPFHSSGQDPIKEDVLQMTRDIHPTQKQCELVSTVTGCPFQVEDYSSDYWWKNIRNTVQFKEGIEQCSTTDIFIEIAPHVVLTSYIQSVSKTALVLHSAHRRENGPRRFLSTLAKLYLAGAPVDLSLFGRANNTHYPLYRWNKKLHYQGPPETYNRRHGITEKQNIIRFSPVKYPYIKDHIVGSKCILPTVTYLDLIDRYILEADQVIKNFVIHAMYEVTTESIVFRVERKGQQYAFHSTGENPVHYLSFCVESRSDSGPVSIQSADELLKLKLKLKLNLSPPDFVSRQQWVTINRNKNFNFGEKITVFKEGYLGKHQDILCKIDPIKNNTYRIYPPVLDTCLLSINMRQGLANNYQYLPQSIESIEYMNRTTTPYYVYTTCHLDTKKRLDFTSYVLDEHFEPLVVLRNVCTINVTNNLTKMYKLLETPIPEQEQEQESAVILPLHPSEDLLNLRDLLLPGKGRIYLVDIGTHYERVGFVRSLLNEQLDFRVCFYIAPDCPPINRSFPKTDYREMYYAQGQFSEMTLDPYLPVVRTPETYFVSYTEKGSLQNVKFKDMNLAEGALGPDEVLIDIKACGVNFKDLAVLYDWVKDTNVGYELSGVVIQSNSTKFKTGDLVIAMGQHCFANRTICHERFIWYKPPELSFEAAAGIALSYGTAYLTLIDFAKIRPKDTVLIHSATGALGLAAIEICKYIGCQIIASAGSQEKRDYLKLQGIDWVTDSRDSVKYTQDVTQFTDGGGVDVVLASVVGKQMEANLALLKPGGIYVDVGKKLIYEQGVLPLKYCLKSIQYHSVHFDELLKTQNARIQGIVDKILYLIQEQHLKIFPLKCSPIGEVKIVLQDFAKSNHIGKYVLTVPSAFRPTDSLFPDRLFAPDKYYLITGGLGGLGEKLIEWMESLGARKFLITSRSSTTPTRPDRIVLQTDLLDPLALKALLEPYAIDGVFHLAGMICDKLAKDLTPGDLPQVLNVKTKGLANLGRIFEARTHTYFVAFSSIVALIGNPGQSVYSAANSYMDAYCQKRQARGLPGLSVNLGAIGGCGMIGYPLAKTMLTNGINFTVYHDFFEQLKHCLVDPSLKQVCITDQNWNNLSHFQTRIFRPFLTDGAVKCASISVMESTDQLRVFLLGLLDLKEINMDKNLISYGVDSIMSMEIANWCTGHLGINIKQIDLLQGMSMTDILNRREHQNENGLIDQPVVLKNGRLFSFTPLHGQPPLQVVPVKGQQNTGGLLLGAIGLAMAYYWPMNFFPSTTT